MRTASLDLWSKIDNSTGMGMAGSGLVDAAKEFVEASEVAIIKARTLCSSAEISQSLSPGLTLPSVNGNCGWCTYSDHSSNRKIWYDQCGMAAYFLPLL